MATFVDDEEELWKKCPFNAIHYVSKRRYSLHLLKCPERNTEQVVQCPYNRTHRIEATKYQMHLEECGTRNQCLREAHEQYRFKNKTGKSFLYEVKEEKAFFEDMQIAKALSESERSEPVVIPGLQQKLEADELAERFEKTDLIPSSFAVQRLPKSSRKKFHDLIVAVNKLKAIECDEENNAEIEHSSEAYDFYKAWNYNCVDKENKVVNNEKYVFALNIESDGKSDLE